ncbi:2-oxoglutarate dehydrogenase, E2 component, dihydrolipoamide succinyltransferase [soil metagenome]
MATEVTLPQLGESVTEGTITAWLVEVGDSVETDQPLFELSSDKIDTEVPAPASGVLTEIRVEVDETVDVGTVVAIIGAADEGSGGDDGAAPAQDEAPQDEAPQDEAAQDEAAQDEASPDQAEEPETDEAADGGEREDVAGQDEQGDGQPPATEDAEPADDSANGHGQLVSPIVRRLAAENDLDLSEVSGSGEGGRITREDVEAAISGAPAKDQRTSARPQPSPGVSMKSGDRERVEDLSRIRQRIAAKMMESLQSSAQLTTVQEADVTRIMRVRSRYKEEFSSREGVSLSPFVFLCRAAVLALRKEQHARLNAVADWEAGKAKFHDYVNLGLAVDTERGLLVPNVKRADDLTLPALARAIAEAANKARGKGKLEMQDIEGGTFTVTNTGSVGVLIDTPILNYPEVAILGTGAIKKRPIVVEDDAGAAIAVRDMIYFSLTYDHRLVDGADAARFITEVAELCETHDWEAELGY